MNHNSTVRTIGRLRNDFGYSLSQLARCLSRRNVPLPGSMQGQWSRAKIAFLIRRFRMRVAIARADSTKAEREALVRLYNYRCCQCGAGERIELDHIIKIGLHHNPLSTNGLENLQPLCRICNSKKLNEIIDHRINGDTSMLPEEIKQLRASLGESTEEFGARFCKSGRTVEGWEQGMRSPDPLVITLIAKLQAEIQKKPKKQRKTID